MHDCGSTTQNGRISLSPSSVIIRISRATQYHLLKGRNHLSLSQHPLQSDIPMNAMFFHQLDLDRVLQDTIVDIFSSPPFEPPGMVPPSWREHLRQARTPSYAFAFGHTAAIVGYVQVSWACTVTSFLTIPQLLSYSVRKAIHFVPLQRLMVMAVLAILVVTIAF